MNFNTDLVVVDKRGGVMPKRGHVNYASSVSKSFRDALL